MRKYLTIFFFASLCASLAQTTGVVDVQLTVTATAGTIQCVVTPTSQGQSASVVCKKGTNTVATATQTPAIDAVGVVLTVAAPLTPTTSDAVSVLLRKTTAVAPVYWEVTANGVMKSGTF